MKDKKDAYNGTAVQLQNNATIDATKTGNILLSGNLRIHAKKAHILMDYTVP